MYIVILTNHPTVSVQPEFKECRHEYQIEHIDQIPLFIFHGDIADCAGFTCQSADNHVSCSLIRGSDLLCARFLIFLTGPIRDPPSDRHTSPF